MAGVGSGFGAGRAVALAVALVLVPPGPVAAEDRARTLADIRAELGQLGAEMERLRRELVGSGGAAAGFDAVSVLDRVQAMDTALRALTARTEELENRVERIVADGTRRLNDLEFRLVELEGGDISAVGRGAPLGGEAAAAAAPAAEAPLMAVGEQAAFAAAEAAFDAGDWEAAAEGFADFIEAFAVGPLTPRAQALRAEALGRMGETARAARAWLAAFESDPEGPGAAAALLGLGRSLGALGQVEEACIMLDEIGFRFPGSAAAAEAVAARREVGCP